MPKKDPWHSIKGTVYHDNSACTLGNNIESENKRPGKGNKPRCKQCAGLDKPKK